MKGGRHQDDEFSQWSSSGKDTDHGNAKYADGCGGGWIAQFILDNIPGNNDFEHNHAAETKGYTRTKVMPIDSNLVPKVVDVAFEASGEFGKGTVGTVKVYVLAFGDVFFHEFEPHTSHGNPTECECGNGEWHVGDENFGGMEEKHDGIEAESDFVVYFSK
jgi:hypothetical protein